MSFVTFFQVGLRRFGVVCTQKDRQTAETLLSLYKQVCSSLGINFGPAGEVVTVKGNNPNDFRATLADYAHPERVSNPKTCEVHDDLVCCKCLCYCGIYRFSSLLS